MQYQPGLDDALVTRLDPDVFVEVTDGATYLDLVSDSWADAVTVTRELSGELPDAASLVVGGVSAVCTVSGDALHPQAPKPTRTRDSRVWLGADLNVFAGYGLNDVSVFSGRVSELDASEESGVLKMEGRDAADRLAAPVRLRPFGSWRERVSGTTQRHPTNTLNVIASILHSNGIRVTPAPRSEMCELYVPGVGGWLADIGWTWAVGASQSGSALGVGKFLSAPDRATESVYGFLQQQRSFYPGGSGVTWMVEAWVNVTSGMNQRLLSVVSTGGYRVDVSVSGGLLRLAYVTSWGASTEVETAPISTGWHHVAAKVGGLGLVTRSLWIDGTSQYSSTASTGVSFPVSDVVRVEWPGSGVQVVQFYWTDSAAFPDPSVPAFTPEADLSVGELDLLSIPDVDGRNSWDVLKEIAAAELGMVGFDENGVFFFRSRADLAVNSSPVATWDVDLVDDIGATVSIDTVLTRATAVVNPRWGVAAGRGAETEASTAVAQLVASEVITIPAGYSSYVVSGSYPVLAEQQRVFIANSIGYAWEYPVGMVVCNDASGSTIYSGSGVSAYISPESMTSWRIHFANFSGAVRYVVWPEAWTSPTYDVIPHGFDGGSPAFWILGYGFDGDSAEVLVDRADSAGVAAWGDRTHAFGSSPWWQDRAVVEGFVDGFLADTAQPRAQVQKISVPADPRWQLGDTVRVKDWRGRVPGFVARITSIELTLTREVEHSMVGVYGLRQVVGDGPVITAHPSSVTVTAGTVAEFNASVTGATSYRWQRESRPGVGFVDIPGYSGVLTGGGAVVSFYIGAAVADSGARFRCRFTNVAGDDTTNPATLTVTA